MKPFIVPLLLLGMLLPLCAQDSAQPAATDFQSDRCAECNMVVNNRIYAAQIVNSGKPLFFDDIGCLVQYERQGKVQTNAVQARFVRSVTTDAWLEVTKAVWVSTKDVRTPMGYGLHAFVDLPAAEAFARGKAGAKVLNWKDLPDLIPAKMGMGMGKK